MDYPDKPDCDSDTESNYSSDNEDHCHDHDDCSSKVKTEIEEELKEYLELIKNGKIIKEPRTPEEREGK